MERQPNEDQSQPKAGTGEYLATATYILYLSALTTILHPVFIVLLILAAVGVGLAYHGIFKSSAEYWVKTHFQYQIVTFWAGVVGAGLAMLIYPASNTIGYMVHALVLAWILMRCIYGLGQISRKEQIAEPGSFLLGWKRKS